MISQRRTCPISRVLGIVGLMIAAPVAAQEQATSRALQPNIVLIIADDLGYGETGMMGNSEIPTPNIDALAREGVRCTAGYVTSSYCSPSRAGIFTGRYQSRFGYDINPTGPANFHPNAGLPDGEETFLEPLSRAGYTTALLGKWHLGASEGRRPLERGFDEFFGFLHEGHYYVPGPPYREVVTMIRDTSLESGQRVSEGHVIRGNYARMSEPQYDQDNPIQRGTSPSSEATYLTDAITEEAIDFITRQAEKPFCAVVAYNAVHSPMQALLKDTQSLQRIQDPQRRIFAGMLIALDRGVGQIRQTLDQLQLKRRTLVVFISDNGGPTAELTSSNEPLRGGKGTLYEGGVRVPLVWSLPGVLPSGVTEDRPVLSLDIAATALQIAAGDGSPEEAEAFEALDGVSVTDWLGRRDRPHPHPELYWRMSDGKLAYREGNWKIVRHRRDEPVELYHLASDLSESRNLANDQPEVLKRLVNAWRAQDAKMSPALDLSLESEQTKTTGGPPRPAG